MRIDLSGEPSFEAVVSRIATGLEADRQHADAPLATLAAAGGAPLPSNSPAQAPSPHPLCQAAFALASAHGGEADAANGALRPFRCENCAPKNVVNDCMVMGVRGSQPVHCHEGCVAAMAGHGEGGLGCWQAVMHALALQCKCNRLRGDAAAGLRFCARAHVDVILVQAACNMAASRLCQRSALLTACCVPSASSWRCSFATRAACCNARWERTKCSTRPPRWTAWLGILRSESCS